MLVLVCWGRDNESLKDLDDGRSEELGWPSIPLELASKLNEYIISGIP